MAIATMPLQTQRLKLANRQAFKPYVAAHAIFLASNAQKYSNNTRKELAAIHLKRREILLSPICVGRSHKHNEEMEYSASLPSPSEVVKTFYSSINYNDMSMLNRLIAKNCIFEDSAHLKPLEGKMIHHFCHELANALGEHVEFVIDKISEGSDLTVAAVWHLEWKKHTIPFTKGCSFFNCAVDGDDIFIQKAHIFVESPIKPGEIAMDALKFVVSVFNKFPKLTEKFLEKPDAIIHFFVMLYKKFVEPMIFPFLIYYTNFWSFVVRAAKSLLNMILQIIYNFFK